MKNQLCSLSEKSFRQSHRFSSTVFLQPCLSAGSLLLFLCFVSVVGAQSVYDVAFHLDSIYTNLKNGEERSAAAEEFVRELSSIFPSGVFREENRDLAVRRIMQENPYFREVEEEVFSEITIQKAAKELELDSLREVRFSLLLGVLDIYRGKCDQQTLSRRKTNSQTSTEALLDRLNFDCSEVKMHFDSLGNWSRRGDDGLDYNQVRRELLSLIPKMQGTLDNVFKEFFNLDRTIRDLEEAELSEKILFDLNVATNSAAFSNTAALASQPLTSIVLKQEGSGSLQSSLIDGAAKWIAERMREELSIAFFDRFSNWMERDNIKSLFPATFGVLQSSITTDYTLLIEIYKSAFEKDLNNLPFNIAEYLQLELDYNHFNAQVEKRLDERFLVVDTLQLALQRVENRRRELDAQYAELYQTTNAEDDNNVNTLYNYYDRIFLIMNDTSDFGKSLRYVETQLAEVESSSDENIKIIQYLLFTVQAVRILSEGEHVLDLVSYLSEHIDRLFPNSGPIRPALLVFDELLRSLSTLDEQREINLLKPDQVMQLGQSAQFRSFYFGLLYEKIKQTIGVKNLELQNRLKRAVNKQITLDANVPDRPLYLGQVLANVKSLLYNNDFSFLKAREENSEQVAKEMVENYLYYEGERFKKYYEWGARTFHTELTRNPDIARIYNPEEYERLDTESIANIQVFSDQIYGLAQKYSDRELEGLALYGLNDLFSFLGDNIDDSSLEVKPERFAPELENRFAPYLSRVSEPADRDSLRRAFNQTASSVLRKYEILGRVYPIMDSLRNLTTRRLQAEVIQPDSVLRIKKYIYRHPELDLINTEITKNLQDLGFVDNLLSSEERFGNLFVDAYKLASKTRAIFKQLQDNQDQKENGQTARQNIVLIKQALASLFRIFELTLVSNESNEVLQTVIEQSDYILDSYAAILDQDYDAVVMNVLPIAEFIFSKFYDLNILQDEYQQYDGYFEIVPDSGQVVLAMPGQLITTNESSTWMKERLFRFVDVENPRDTVRQLKPGVRYQIKSPIKGDPYQEWAWDVASGLTDDGTKVVLWGSHGGGNQQFTLDSLGGEMYAIKGVSSGKYVDFRSESGRIYPFSEDRQQRFRIVPRFSDNPTKNQSPLKDKETKIRALREIFKYGAFLAAVVESRNSEEIKNAIRAIALPTGSYSIKRRTYANISLNAYPGLTAGMELASNKNISKWAPNFGFTAPIGLAFSWGYQSVIDHEKKLTDRDYSRLVDKNSEYGASTYLNGRSGTIFLPLLDLGAVVLFRLQNEEEVLPQDVTLQQIFSPGLMYAHGFRNLPIALMGGFQVSPQLRKFGDERANSFRVNLSLVVDLPLANFYTRRRMK